MANGYPVWDPVNKRITAARDVDFVEAKTTVKKNAKQKSTKQYVVCPIADETEQLVPRDDCPEEEEAVSSDEEFDSFTNEPEAEIGEEAPDGPADETPAKEGDPVEAVDETADADDQSGRPQRDRTAPAWHRDYEMDNAGFALCATSFLDNIPQTIAELRKRDD